MDAKPQRPARSLRSRGDENLPPMINGPQKTIHQRNKSSPALTTMAGMGKNGGIRTAFGDVSNTANSIRLENVKDDLAYPSKVKAHVPEKTTTAQVLQEKKSAALLRPAQRPLSNTIKSILTNSSNNKKEIENAGRPTSAAEVQAANNITANTRKVLTKRNTTIFKDTSLPTVAENALTSHKAPSALSSGAPVHQSLITSREGSGTDFQSIKESQQISSSSDQSQQSVQHDISHTRVVTQTETSIPVIPSVVDKHFEEPQTFHDTVSIQPSAESEETKSTSAPVAQQVVDDRISTTSVAMPGTLLEPIHSRFSHSALPETEEYWDDEENVEDDGYVTAHSYRSRGENTTGGATTLLFPQVTRQVKKELAAAKQLVEASRTQEEIDDECFDTSMVAEYGDEIFEYMKELEVKLLPNAHYMDNQAEIQWSMRSVLIDWVVQVHLRFGLLPETLFLTVNYIDRFLSCKIVSLGKLQLVGATALFIAAKYEEINCPSVQEIVYMVDGGYTTDEVLKAERFMLSMLQFELGFPGPMSFLRRISKADDYDLETRTLAKYFLEVTVMDERFVGSPASFVAAGSHCLARLMLRKGTWGPSHVHYSGYTYSQLLPLLMLMVECCECPRKHHSSVFNKYHDKRFKRASAFVETEMVNGFRLPASQNEINSPRVVDYFEQVSWRRVG